jgi:hypothetical protein
MTSTILQSLRRLADARAEREALAGELKLRREQFDAENAALIADVKSAADTVEAAEREVRALAEATYRATGEKAVAPGVVVKLFTTPRITDRVAAETWARETKLALIPESLDEKALFKIAAVSPLPFVELLETPKVTIATQLNAAELSNVEVG